MPRAVQQTLDIDPDLVEGEGITTASPALQNATRSGLPGAPQATMRTVLDKTGSYVLLSSVQANGQDSDHLEYQPQDGEDDRIGPGSKATTKPKKRRGRPRKLKSATDPADPTDVIDDNNSVALVKKRRPQDAMEDENEEEGDELQEPPQKRTKESGENDTTTGEGDAELPQSGPLVKVEQGILDEHMKEYRERHALEQPQVNEMIQNTSRAQSEQTKELWNLLYDALPQRTHVSIMRATRRRYHNYEVRGKWTPADDELLRDVHNSNPGKWVKIGAMLGRMPEDCRDRWRNYLSCGDERKTDDWAEKEELELQNAVQECVTAARQAAKDRAKEQGHAFRELDWETFVNFNNVSEKMKFTRSRLQCYTHWRVMQKRGSTLSGVDGDEQEAAKSTETKNPTRRSRALAKYEKMTAVDKFNILRKIAESDYTDEGDINWKAINRQDPGSGWSTRDRKEAFAKMKELVPPQETLVELIEALSGYLAENFSIDFELAGQVDEDGFNAAATGALLQREIDASSGVSRSRDEAKQSLGPDNASDIANDHIADNADSGALVDANPEQDIQDIDVARTLQGIAQQSQEQGDFVAMSLDSRSEEPTNVLELGVPWSTRPARKRGKKKA